MIKSEFLLLYCWRRLPAGEAGLRRGHPPVTRAAAVGDEHPVLPLSISYNGSQNLLKKIPGVLKAGKSADRNELAGGREKKKWCVVV